MIELVWYLDLYYWGKFVDCFCDFDCGWGYYLELGCLYCL